MRRRDITKKADGETSDEFGLSKQCSLDINFALPFN